MNNKEFLVSHAYDGNGGETWAFIKANSAEEVAKAYPCFEIIKEKPAWMPSTTVMTLPRTGLNDPVLKNICQEAELNTSTPEETNR